MVSEYVDAVLGKGHQYFGIEVSRAERWASPRASCWERENEARAAWHKASSSLQFPLSATAPMVWLPYTAIDQLLQALRESSANPSNVLVGAAAAGAEVGMSGGALMEQPPSPSFSPALPEAARQDGGLPPEGQRGHAGPPVPARLASAPCPGTAPCEALAAAGAIFTPFSHSGAVVGPFAAVPPRPCPGMEQQRAVRPCGCPSLALSVFVSFIYCRRFG